MIDNNSSDNNPTINNLSDNNPSINNPSINNPSINNPSINNPSINNPSINNPSINNPSINNPSINNPSINNIIPFIWKKENQNKYYNIVINNYIYKIFEHIKKNSLLFYLKYDNTNDFINTIKYYNGTKINIEDFKHNKKFIKYNKFPKNTSNNTYDVSEDNVGLSITKLDNIIDNNCNIGGCGQCHKQYGKGLWFEGYAYNTGPLRNDKKKHAPYKYEGYIKVNDFHYCDCDRNRNNISTIECNNYDNIPSIIIDCSIPNKNICLLRHCILFNIYYSELKHCL